MKECDFKKGEDYWYVFIPVTAINLQNVKIEKVYLEEISENGFDFKVYRYENGKEFLTLNIRIEKNDTEDYSNIFHIDEQEKAEMYWAKEFFKNFKPVHGIEFCEFINLYNKIQKEYPEWIL